MMITKEATGALRVQTPYNPAFVGLLKNAVPWNLRTYVPAEKVWLVDAKYGQQVFALVKSFWASDNSDPAILQTNTVNAKVTKRIEVRYLGRAKPRQDGTVSATGFSEGNWTVVFPKAVLLAWFNATDLEHMTHYQRLNLPKSFTPDQLKAAYRQLARQWHPDVCREPNAEVTFKAINEAYQVLKDPVKRYDYDIQLARYEAGKQFEQMLKTATRMPKRDRKALANGSPETEWAPPLRCGYIEVTGTYIGGKLVVEKINKWQDITDANGKTLVSSWEIGQETFTEHWV